MKSFVLRVAVVTSQSLCPVEKRAQKNFTKVWSKRESVTSIHFEYEN